MKTKLLLTILIITLWSCQNKTTSTHNPTNDSIQKYLTLAEIDTLPNAQRYLYNKKAISFIDLTKNDTATRWYLYKTGRVYYFLNRWNDLIKTFKVLENKSLISKDSINLARSYLFIESYHTDISENDSAIKYCLKAKKVFEKLKDLKNLSVIYYDISSIQTYECDYFGSNKNVLKAINLAKKINNNSLLINYNDRIAYNSLYLKEYNKAIEYYLKSDNYYKKTESYSKSFLFQQIGYINLMQNKFKTAIRYYKTSINNYKKDKKNISYSFLIDQYAFCKLKLKDYSELPKLFFEAEKIRDENNIDNGRQYNKIYLSEYYATMKDTAKAILYAQKAVALSKSFKNPTDVLLSLKQLLAVDTKNAQKHAKEYIQVSDSLQLRERRFRDKFARLEYETDEITQEKETAIKQKWVIASIAGLLIALGVLLFVIKMQRNKQKELMLVQSQQKANEEIYQLMLQQNATEEKAKQTEKTRIARELHDGILNKLASTRLNLFMLSKNNDKETIDNALNHVSKIQDIESEIRDIAHNLNQDVFRDNTSFTTLLEKLIANQNQISATTFILEMDTTIQWEQIPGSVKMNFYRIIQEAIHNTNKYAKATKASISIILDEKNLCMSITDNGIGFDMNKEKNGIGIKNMQQRVETLNGKISFDSVINKGTSIYLSAPIK